MAIVVLGDSLAFHGPERGEPADDPRLWPNLVGAALGRDVALFARQGWTARDAWWALTRDPSVWARIATADAFVLATGGMDKLPTVLPSYLRLGFSHLPTAALRGAARSAYLAANPPAVRLVNGPLRHLGQRQTDAYLSQTVDALRQVRPELPIAAVLTHPWGPRYYPNTRNHGPYRAATTAWAARAGVPLVDWEGAVGDLPLNPDGMHLGWEAHRAVAVATVEVLRPLLIAPIA